MGYQTDFQGTFWLDRHLTVEHLKKLIDFAEERHEDGKSDYPGYYCQWVPNETGDGIVWDGNEKFYDYVEWIEYLIKHFLGPWGYKLTGKVRWDGEERGDHGTILVKDNVVKSALDSTSNPLDEED